MLTLADRTVTLLHDGLPVADAQAAVFAGIGGHMTMRIIENGLDMAKRMQCLILQPADDAAHLRKSLNGSGFDIYEEAIVYEGRYFPILAVRFDGIQRQPLNDVACEIGTMNMKHPNRTVLNYARWRIRVWENTIQQPAASARGQENQGAALRLVRELMGWCEENSHAADA